MEWQEGGDSSDVEDRRDESGGGGYDGGGGGGFGGGGIGIVGVVVLLIVSVVTGRNYLGAFLHGGGAPMQQTQQTRPMNAGGAPQAHTAAEDRDKQLMVFTLNDVQKTWTGIFEQEGRTYRHAGLVIYRGRTSAGCGGVAQAATGPFYCPEDQKVYIDLSFWDELRRFGGSTADFAQAYVLAHEVGHHVQYLLGTEAKVRRLEQQEPGERNHLSVETELQADCYGGVWANSAQKRGVVDPGDVDAALSAVAAVGDDHLAKISGRAVNPESWTHGSSAQRQMWFKKGFESGTRRAAIRLRQMLGGKHYAVCMNLSASIQKIATTFRNSPFLWLIVAMWDLVQRPGPGGSVTKTRVGEASAVLAHRRRARYVCGHKPC